MDGKKKWKLLIILFIVAILIHFFSSDSRGVEHYYSQGIYPYISAVLKLIFGWLPFSAGDIIYGFCALWLVFKFIKTLLLIVNRKLPYGFTGKTIRLSLLIMLCIYISFNVLWGTNYNRTGITGQLDLTLEKYSTHDVLVLDSLLLLKVNQSKIELPVNGQPVNTTQILKGKTVDAYKKIVSKYPFLNASPISLKPSMWGWLGNYLGFIGYYNPFTGEAQVNTTVPAFIQPFTFCHETAHQLGYARENEANFVGYLAAAASDDPSFHYSVYLDLFLYAQRNLYLADSAAASSFSKKLLPSVKADLLELRNFNASHQNPFEPVVRWMYSTYLKNNQQPSGVLSYDEVVGFLIAYYKKNGTI